MQTINFSNDQQSLLIAAEISVKNELTQRVVHEQTSAFLSGKSRTDQVNEDESICTHMCCVDNQGRVQSLRLLFSV